MTSVIEDTKPATPTTNILGTAVDCEMMENGNNEEQIITAASVVINNCNQSLMVSEIKQEDPLDIDDMPAEDMKRMPIISLTPTSKLLATPNPINPKRKFVCPYDNCGKSYGKSSHLRSHLTWHTGIKPFVCQEPNCGKGFTRSDELNRHVRTHTGEKPFECMECLKKFSRSDHLTKHLATHVKQQKGIKRKSNNSNMTTNNVNESPVTPVQKTRQQPKRTLTETNSVGGQRMEVFPTNEHRQQDNGRGGVFSGSDDREKTDHQPIKIKLERPENSTEYQIVPTSILKNTSDFSELNSETGKEELIVGGDDEIMPEANVPSSLPLDVIIKNEPIDHDIERPFRCEVCFRTFRRETDLNRHRHVHSDSRNMTYDGQHPSSDVNESLDVSLLQFKDDNFDPERPFSCKECTKAFRRQDDLNRHMRTHTGEKPYACNECDRRFVRSDHLKKHMQTHIRLR